MTRNPSSKPISSATLPPTVARHCGLIDTFTCGSKGTSVCAEADAYPEHGNEPEKDNSKVEFTTENTLSLMSNLKFMATSGTTIEDHITITIAGYRIQGKQVFNQVSIEIATNKLVDNVTVEKKLVDTAIEKITAIPEKNVEASKRLVDVEQVTEAVTKNDKCAAETATKTDTGAAEAAAKRAAVEVLVQPGVVVRGVGAGWDRCHGRRPLAAHLSWCAVLTLVHRVQTGLVGPRPRRARVFL